MFVNGEKLTIKVYEENKLITLYDMRVLDYADGLLKVEHKRFNGSVKHVVFNMRASNFVSAEVDG